VDTLEHLEQILREGKYLDWPYADSKFKPPADIEWSVTNIDPKTGVEVMHYQKLGEPVQIEAHRVKVYA